MKTCGRCGETKPISEFHKLATNTYCRVCTKAYNAEYYKRHTERLKARTANRNAQDPEGKRERDAIYRNANREKLRTWHRNHRWRHAINQGNRSARRYNCLIIPFTEDQLAMKFSLWNDCCWICGDTTAEIDHVKPLSKNGAHALANIRPICRHCNNRKSSRWPVPSRAWLLCFTKTQTPCLAGHFNGSS